MLLLTAQAPKGCSGGCNLVSTLLLPRGGILLLSQHTDISISFKFVVMDRFEGLLLFTEDSSSITQRECNLISWFQWPEFGWIHESFLAKVNAGPGGCLCR